MLKHFLALLSIAGSSLGQQIGAAPSTVAALKKELPDTPASQAANVHNPWYLNRNLAELAVNSSANGTPPESTSLDGTRARLVVASEISSKQPSGSSFQARLMEPISSGGQVALPQGPLFEGHIETKRARRLMRPGSLFMTFERVVLPNGEVQPVNLHLVSSDSRAVKTDEEGRVHPALSKKRLAIHLGRTALAAKIADDLAEEAGGAAVGAGSARFVGMAAAATFFALQKGREAKLRPGDKLEIEFGRPGSNMPLAAPGAQNGLGPSR